MNMPNLTHVPKDMTSRSLNIVLFGETGSGKSAVINLLTGALVAQTSSDIDGCTNANKGYPFNLDGISYIIWDTVGLEQPMMGDDAIDAGYFYAIEQVCRLIKYLSKTSRVDLLLLCHRRGRITTTTQRNYTLVYEVMCRKSVPIGVVITHLEQEERMEDWWAQNADIFQQRKIEVFGHACVTTLSADRMAQESRGAIERLLDNGGYRISTENPTELPAWRTKDLFKLLRKYCGLRDDHACRITQLVLAE